MSCSGTRQLLSAAADDACDDQDRAIVDAHVAQCVACRQWASQLARLRRELRFEVVGDVPDVTERVLRRIRPRPRRARPRLASAAAVFVLAAIVGAGVIGFDVRKPPTVSAAALPETVVAAQSGLDQLAAQVSIVERGWHSDVPVRRYTGTLRYAAPETMHLSLRDHTIYPAGPWVANDTDLVVDGDRWWRRGPAPCPPQTQPQCGAVPRTRALIGRAPFDGTAPAPLDLVLPARSFMLAAEPPMLQQTTAAGRRALALEATVAQLQPLLDGIRGAGDWRELYPADPVRLWLDTQTLVPLAVRVEPAAGDARDLWAARRGYRDPPGSPVFEMRLASVRFAGVRSTPPPPTPDGAMVRDAGFRPRPDTAVDAPTPAWVPAGMRPHLAGVVRAGGPGVDVRSWTDGRAWITVQATATWPARRLFGMDGGAVRMVDLGDAGTGYMSEDGARVAVHGDGIDVVVSGSLPPDVLRRVAASLPVVGRAVPAHWTEASSTTLDQIGRDHPHALVPDAPEGFGPPAGAVQADTITLSYAGAGVRGFVLTQSPGTRLTPPLHGDVHGVVVRGRQGRYTPTLGELEWVEAGRVLSLRSRTLTLDELITIAAGLQTP